MSATVYFIEIKFRDTEDLYRITDMLDEVVEENNMKFWSREEIVLLYRSFTSWEDVRIMDVLHDIFASVPCTIQATYKDSDGVTRKMVFDNDDVQTFVSNTTWTLEESYPWPPCEE